MVLLATIGEPGIEAAVRQYRELKLDQADAFDFGEALLNTLGCILLGGGQVEAAIEFFALNAEVFPDSWNVWDGPGEAWLRKGEAATVRKYYRKSLELNPNNTKAATVLESLGSETPPAGGGPS